MHFAYKGFKAPENCFAPPCAKTLISIAASPIVKLRPHLLFVLIALNTLLLAGCSSVPPPVHAEARGTPTLATLMVSCATPHRLEQDCDSLKGATRKMELGGTKIRVAGSSDGRVTLIMDPDPVTNIANDMRNSGMSTRSPSHSEASNAGLEAVKAFYQSQSKRILSIQAMTSLGNVDGYFVVTEGNGYTALIAADKQVPRF